jgi:hypothetical protein
MRLEGGCRPLAELRHAFPHWRRASHSRGRSCPSASERKMRIRLKLAAQDDEPARPGRSIRESSAMIAGGRARSQERGASAWADGTELASGPTPYSRGGYACSPSESLSSARVMRDRSCLRRQRPSWEQDLAVDLRTPSRGSPIASTRSFRSINPDLGSDRLRPCQWARRVAPTSTRTNRTVRSKRIESAFPPTRSRTPKTDTCFNPRLKGPP